MPRTDCTTLLLRSPRTPGARRAFTLMELLVVISLIALLLAIAAPSINSIIKSTEDAAAKNQLDVAMAAARSVAITSESGSDTAAVFFYKPGGKCSIGIFRKVGQIQDLDAAGNQSLRDIFVPVGQQPYTLPSGWMIRGLAPVGSMHDDAGDQSGWYEPMSGKREFQAGTGGAPWWNWIFPETGFYNPKKPDEVKDQGLGVRQTFMVRFEAGSGLVKTGDRTLSLVIDPSPSSAFRNQAPYRYYRFNRGEDVGVIVSQILAAREVDLPIVDKRKLLGDQATDTVLCQSITEIALYREVDLAVAVGAGGLNRTTRCLYGDNGKSAYKPQIDPSLFPAGFSAPDFAKKTNEWFATDDLDADAEPGVAGAYVYTIDRASGRPTEVR